MRRSFIVGGIILLFILIFIWIIARRGDSPEQAPEVARQSTLVDYAESPTEMRFTMEGRIKARENYRVVQIHIGRDYRNITIYEGYQGAVVRQETYLNDRNAYKTFLAALQNEGYTRAREGARGVDPQGACPLGKRFRYDIVDGNDTKQSLWSTNCGNAKGTFSGRATPIRTLFEEQIPNYRDLVKGVQF